MALADALLSVVPFRLPPHLTSFIPHETPLSTTPVVLGTLVGYLVLIFGIQAAMKNSQPQKLNTLFQAHNVFLSSGSLLLLVLTLEEIIPIVWRTGLFNGLCAEESWTPRMEFYYMVNYYFKYLELLDTVFLAFKKKPLAFLHVFHHSATALLCYSQLVGKTSIVSRRIFWSLQTINMKLFQSWTVISLNLAVHVLMYYYYYATAGGAKIWWKKYLTTMQIVQFVIDLFLVYFGTYNHFAASYYADSLPFIGNCAGSETAALFGCGLLTSYLGLFINFYIQTYKKGPRPPRANGVANGHANGHANGKSMSEFGSEHLVSAEVYVSTAAGAALRKLPDGRPINGTLPPDRTSAPDDKRLREKSSWLTLARGATGAGQWRSATCKLSEEGSRCLLNIYVDETILYQTLFIHLLNHTDIRLADPSLFFRKDCLGIYSLGSQRWISNAMHANEPVYLQFANSETCSTWLGLLRSYAVPEIYGRLLFPQDGGSYRMWRQVELTVIQARNLGNTRVVDLGAGANAAVISGSGPELAGEGEPVDAMDVSCEIHLNNMLCGRTTLKKGIGSPDWHESFTFMDLPPFDTLEVLVWREKKLFKPSLLGSVRVTLANFRRGESVEGWFPVLHQGPTVSDLQVGDIRLKIRVDEEIILPLEAYGRLLHTFNRRNFLEWMTDFETKFKLKTISHQLISIAVAKNDLIEQVQEIAAREVDGTPSSHQTLFRGNTIFTKVMELCMNWYGKAFLEASIGQVLRRLCAEKVAIEVDPLRNGKGEKDVQRNLDLLIHWCQEFWTQIYSVRRECPIEMRQLFETIRQLVEKHYKVAEGSPPETRELPWQSVSAFCFLRFIVPAILHPHLFGLCPGMPSIQVQRSLTLIAKVIQSLANLNASVQKEEHMRGVKDFLLDSRSGMIDYILIVSSPNRKADGETWSTEDPGERHERLAVANALLHRTRSMAVLSRESIPLPLIPDVPKQLAIITSAIIRHSRDYQPRSRIIDPADQALHDFSANCYEVEEHALQRVSQLATRISSQRRRTEHAPSHSVSEPRKSTKSSGRPSTAPSPSDPNYAARRIMADPASPSSPTRYQQPDDPRARKRHLKSPSTDSISYPNQHSTSPMGTLDAPDSDEKKKRGLLRNIWRR
ncbi:Elongation of fatty acids protein [Mycena kentingensis (nom. inval.)]|nr:Elongation of fatty acids protein [Mycena kentingensis (nom. inval.)]